MEDKYLWLEEVLDEKCLSWARLQNEKTFAALTNEPEFEKLVDGLTDILASKDKIPTIHFIKNGYVYNHWTDDKNIQGLLRRTKIEEYKKPNPVWETILGYDEQSRIDDEKWVNNGFSISPDKKRALVFLSPGGSDADIVREFDMETKTFVKGGFELPLSKGGASWLNDDELLLERNFGPDSLTESGYARTVRHWKRGVKLEDAKVIFEIPATDTMLNVHTLHDQGQSRTLIQRRIDFYSGEILEYKNGKCEKLDLPKKCDENFNIKKLHLTLREEWNGFRSGDYVVYDFETKKTVLAFSPEKKTSIYTSRLTKDGILLIIDKDVKGTLLYLTEKNEVWTPIQIDLPENGSLDALETDRDSNDYFIGYDSFNSPLSYYSGSAEKINGVVKRQTSFFDYDKLEVSQHFAKSLDGTMIPYFLVHQKGLKLDGENPTILYGYGGFEVSLKSHFSNLLGYAWLDKGGVYVLSNIRGGGEYGPEWHQCALKENRDRAYQDFFAIAEELISKKITSREHLGAWGGSNGGLLMGVCYTQRPNLFKAINCGVPLLDMHRYHKLLAGHSWVAEYGNPDDEVEGIYIRALSPYQRIKKDEKNYPVIFLNTSTKDDRVHPGHARKFAAKLEEYGHPYFYHENIEGGHAGASNMKELAFMKALDYMFFWKFLK
ncbi:MAG: S9 family peptidase [Bacteriovorax sp.]|nr:S9 family peptidase [Bacteriovorax sp.]